MNSKNKRLIITSILFSVFLICFMTSYAFFEYNGNTNSIIMTSGEIYLRLNSNTPNINLTSMFPETTKEAELRNDNYIDFEVSGRSEGKDIYYSIYLDNGDEVSSKTRINDKYIKYSLYSLDDDTERVIIDSFNVEENSLNDGNLIWVDNFKGDTLRTRKYRVRIWIDEDVLISNNNPNASYSSLEYSNLYASIKVRVYGDNEVKKGIFAYVSQNYPSQTTYATLDNYKKYNPLVLINEGMNAINNPLWPMDFDADAYRNRGFFLDHTFNIKKISFLKLTETEIDNLLDTTVFPYYDLTSPVSDHKVYMIFDSPTNSQYDLNCNIVSTGIISLTDCRNLFCFEYSEREYETKIYFDSLNSLDLSNLYTGEATNFDYAFYGVIHVNNLNELIKDHIRTKNATSMRAMFSGLPHTFELDINRIDTTNVTDMAFMFAYSKFSKIIGLEDMDTSLVKDMRGMFQGFAGFTEIDLSSWNTDSLEKMSMAIADSEFSSQHEAEIDSTNSKMMYGSPIFVYPYYYAYSMFGGSTFEKVNLSNWNVENVDSIYKLFECCYDLKEVYFDNWNMVNCTDYSKIFHYNTGLLKVSFNNFRLSTTVNFKMERMFYFCWHLPELDLSSFDMRMCSSCVSMFDGASALNLIYASRLFDVSGILPNTTNMFSTCGVSFYDVRPVEIDVIKYDGTYAKINEPGSPGLFTLKN